MRMPARFLLVGATLSCGTGLDEQYPDDTSGGGAVGIFDIDPDWGPPTGGTVVTITGWGFEGDVQVLFGESDLAVTRIDSETVVVTSPAIGFEIPVDVTVRSGLGEATIEEGFRYSDEEPVDTGDTDTSTDTGSGTGKVGGLIQMSRLQIACPDCFGATTDLQITSSAAFHQPVAGTWTDWLPGIGSCAINPSITGPSAARIDVGEWAYLNSGSASIPMRRTTGESGVLYEGNNLGLEDFITNAAYDLSVPDGGDLGAFEVQDAAYTPQGFTSLTPAEMLYTQPASAFSAVLRKSGTNITWAPSGGTGSFVVFVDVYSPDGASYLGSVLCRGADNGSMNLPGAAFSSYPTNSLLGVGVYRYQIEEAVLPANGATIQSIAQTGVLGTAILK